MPRLAVKLWLMEADQYYCEGFRGDRNEMAEVVFDPDYVSRRG